MFYVTQFANCILFCIFFIILLNLKPKLPNTIDWKLMESLKLECQSWTEFAKGPSIQTFPTVKENHYFTVWNVLELLLPAMVSSLVMFPNVFDQL